jgi:DNA-binding HxlR family transcriptional regulator
MAVPRPGKAVRGSTTGRPIMALLDLLGRRWALRILWELRNESATFRILRERCDALSPSVLNLRLAELRAAGIVRRDPARGYGLTDEGKNLIDALAPLNDWARRWERRATRK